MNHEKGNLPTHNKGTAEPSDPSASSPTKQAEATFSKGSRILFMCTKAKVSQNSYNSQTQRPPASSPHPCKAVSIPRSILHDKAANACFPLAHPGACTSPPAMHNPPTSRPIFALVSDIPLLSMQNSAARNRQEGEPSLPSPLAHWGGHKPPLHEHNPPPHAPCKCGPDISKGERQRQHDCEAEPELGSSSLSEVGSFEVLPEGTLPTL
jgi:hypothetical protein